MLFSLPDELLLHIVQYLGYNNHANLAPLARASRRLRALVSDHTVWSDEVRLLSHDAEDDTSLLGLQQAHDLSRTSSVILTLNALTVHHGRSLLHSMMQQTTSICQSLQVYAPAAYHATVVEQLCRSPPKAWVEYVLRDMQDTCQVLDSKHKSALLPHLSLSQWTLQTLDIRACPLDWLLSPKDISSLTDTTSPDMVFPNLESLTVSLAPNNASFFTQHTQFWKRCKTVFPRLQHLTLHIHPADDDAMGFLKLLFADASLFPWIKTLTVISPQDLRPMVNQQDLCQFLSSMEGLYRVNMGWDMVALDAL